MPVQLPSLGLNPSCQESNKDEAEIEWLLDTNQSVRSVYKQTITPMADGSFSLPSTTVHGNFVFDLALLLSMATGALMDDQLQTQCIDEFSQKRWLKKTSTNVSMVSCTRKRYCIAGGFGASMTQPLMKALRFEMARA
jgi:hypothetical protein